jgi:hypothetical protein
MCRRICAIREGGGQIDIPRGLTVSRACELRHFAAVTKRATLRGMKRMVLGLAVSLLLCACGKEGSGRAATDSRSVAAFQNVEVDGAVNLEVTLGAASHAVEVHGDDNLLSLVETNVVGDRLVIRTRERVDPEVGLTARVSAPDLQEIKASGISKVGVGGVSNEALRLELSGAGDIEAKGKTKKLTLEVSGAGGIDADELQAEKVEIDMSGAGTIDVAEPKELIVRISGAGSVRYGGQPKIQKDISGAGKLVQR